MCPGIGNAGAFVAFESAQRQHHAGRRWTQADCFRLEAASGAVLPQQGEGNKGGGLVVMATCSEESPRQVLLCGKMLLRTGHSNQQPDRQFNQHFNQQIIIKIWA
jgi:hypothetical protein